MTRWLRPLPFFIGLAGGLVTLSFLGFTLESPRLKADFVRVHQLMDVDSGYYLTAQQMISIVRSRMSPDTKVYVIVGGSSILNGTGQHRAAVWSTYLQQNLGPDFKVINFALRSGSPLVNGNIAAEWLLGQGKAVIYIGDFFLFGTASNVYAGRHHYLMADAWERGYLLPMPKRDAVMRANRFEKSGERQSISLGAMLNRFLNFNDLWSTFAYEVATPNWNFLLGYQGWYRPRKIVPDNDLTPEQLAVHDMAPMAAIERSNLRKAAANPMGISKASIEASRQHYRELVPARLREVTIGVSFPRNPKFVNELEPEQQARMIRYSHAKAQAMAAIGVPTIDTTMSFDADDFHDSIHLSSRGGEKLARILAPEIVKRSRSLKYFP